MPYRAILLIAVLVSPLLADDQVTVLRNRRYKQVGDKALTLDLYLPASDKPTPLVVWIHGGGWRAGNKNRCPITWLNDHGFAVASINYRLTDVAIFPAQIHDCKTAIRALRTKAEKYNLDPNHIAVAGSSAGGHLSALMGTSGGMLTDPSDPYKTSDRVQAVIDFYGPGDLVTLASEASRENHNSANSAPGKLLGGSPSDRIELAKQASPITHIDADDPPMYVIHGEYDRLVPVQQSIDFAEALKEAGVDVTLEIMPDTGHSHGQWMRTETNRAKIVAFLNKHLRHSTARD